MKMVFWHSDKPRERILASAWVDGIKALGLGDTVELCSLQPYARAADCDVALMFGVKSRELYRAHFKAGSHIIYFDKGYSRHKAQGPQGLWEYWRVAVDNHQPTDRLYERDCPGDRWDALGLELKPWRRGNPRRFLLAGSSQKYHDFYGLSDPTRWAEKVAAKLRELAPDFEILYRPKPSWSEAVPIKGTKWGGDGESLESQLERCNALVTHGSNAVFDAMLAGVPQIVLGNAVTRQISTTEITNEKVWPYHASEEERLRWAHNLAYFQWTLPEISSGRCWAWLRPMIYGRAVP